MLVWCLTVTAVSMQTEPIIHLFLEAFALPVGPRHILSSNQQETGDPVRPECQAKQCLKLFSSDLQSFPSIRLLAFFSFLQMRIFISAFSSQPSSLVFSH